MSGIRIYSAIELRDMNLRREQLKKQKKDDYNGMSDKKKLSSRVELNFLEVLLEAQTEGNYI
jgi:hypothetical protein